MITNTGNLSTQSINERLQTVTMGDKVIPVNTRYFEVYGKDGIMRNMSNVMRLAVGVNSQFQRWLIDRYTDMVYKDTFIGHCIEMRSSFVKTLNYEILNNNPDNVIGDQHNAFIEKNITENIDFDLIVREIIRTAMIYGYSCIEKYFKLNYTDKFGTKIEIDGLNSIYPAFIGFNVDFDPLYYKEGFMVGESVNLKSKRDKFIIHSYRPDFQNPYGNSVLTEGIYYLYWMRQEMLLKWFEFTIKYGSPIIYGTFPQLGINPDGTDVSDLINSLSQMRNGFVAAIPEVMKIQQLDLKLEQAKETYIQFWQATELEISNSILYNTMSAENNAYGSYSKNTVYDQIQNTLFFSDAKDVSNTINHQIIKPLIEINYGKQDYYPYIQFAAKDEKRNLEYARTISILQKMGMPITERFVSEYFGIPSSDMDDKLLKPIETMVTRTDTAY